MIVKISRGAQLGGLMRYLVGEGRRNEHTNPHLVAGSPEVMSWYSHRELSRDDARAITRVVDQPRIAHGTSVTVKATPRELARAGRSNDGGPDGGGPGGDLGGGVVLDEGRRQAHVWHCSLSLPPTAATLAERADEAAAAKETPDAEGAGVDAGRVGGERVLEDETWERLATEFVDEMGFTAASGKSPCRWVAVHHGLTAQGGDHVHIAVVLVRQDGTKASTHNDYRKASAAAARLEAKYGLEVVAGRHVGRSSAGAEAVDQRAGVRGFLEVEGESYADRLARKVRAAAAVAGTEAEFVTRCQESGLVLRPRLASGSTSEVTGFAVAEPSAGSSAGSGTGEEEGLQWRAAGKLSRDLTLPRLRTGFIETPESQTAAAELWRSSRGLDDVGQLGDKAGNQAGGLGKAARPAAAVPGAGVPVGSEMEALRWRDAAVQVSGLREQLRAVPVDDHAAWASVSHEVAGVLAAWSAATEKRPGHLAAAADVMGRGAALHARAVGPQPRRPVSLRGPALLVASLAASPGSKTGQALLLRELLNMMRAVNLALVATKQARDATRVEEAVRSRLMRLQATMPQPPKLTADLEAVQLLTRDLRHQTTATPGTPGRSPDRSTTTAPQPAPGSRLGAERPRPAAAAGPARHRDSDRGPER